MISEYIESIGVELEGGMKYSTFKNLQKKFKKWNLDSNLASSFDVSIKRDFSWPAEHSANELKFWSDKLIDIKHFLDWAYTFGDVKTNYSCGFHLHVKFKNHVNSVYLWTKQVTINKFHSAYIEHYKNNQKYMARLHNRYCKKNTLNNRRLLEYYVYGNGERYYSVNLISTTKHAEIKLKDGVMTKYPGTLEFRLFPYQTDSKEAYDTIKWFVKTVDEIMKSYAERDFWIQIFW